MNSRKRDDVTCRGVERSLRLREVTWIRKAESPQRERRLATNRPRADALLFQCPWRKEPSPRIGFIFCAPPGQFIHNRATGEANRPQLSRMTVWSTSR